MNKNKNKKLNKIKLHESCEENTRKSKRSRVIKSNSYVDDKGNCSSESDEETSVAPVEIKDLQCNFCGTAFKTYLLLKSHIGANHRNAYKCSVCSDKQTFKDYSGYMFHMKTFHPEIKPYPCDYPRCSKNFAKAKELRDHMKLHLPFMCKYCKKGFASKRPMKIHVEKYHLT